jgi:hypothetical protein
MASNPKRVRREIKKARRFASRYLGIPIHTKIIKGHGNRTVTRLRGGRIKSTITIDKGWFEKTQGGKADAIDIAKVAQHEFFHAGHEALMLKKAVTSQDIVSEAIAILSNAEFQISRGKRNYGAVLIHLMRVYRNPRHRFYPKNKEDHFALLIAINILQMSSKKRERAAFVRELIKKNSEVVAQSKPGDEVTIDEFGRMNPKSA